MQRFDKHTKSAERLGFIAGPLGILAGAALIIGVATGTAAAVEPAPLCTAADGFPCLQADSVDIQKVPAVSKFQARVSQAKLPIGSATFNEVVVKLLSGTELRCKERFQNVEVRESVLNLEIGRNMSCELDAEIATGSGLAFQVCLGSENSCLKPIALSSVPYAVRASYAWTARNAGSADESVISHYAYRAAANIDLPASGVSTGYFDFTTPSSGVNAGFLRWAPIDGGNTLTVEGKTHADGSSAQLTSLTLNAADVTLTEDAKVTGGLTVGTAGGSGTALTLHGNAQINGNIEYTGTLTAPTSSTSQTIGTAGSQSGQMIFEVLGGDAWVNGGGLTVGGTDASTVSSGLSVTGGVRVIDPASSPAATFDVGLPATFSRDLDVFGDVALRGIVGLTQAGRAAPYAAMMESSESGVLLIGPRNTATLGHTDLVSVQVDSPLTVSGTAPAAIRGGAVIGEGTPEDGKLLITDEVTFSGRVVFSDGIKIDGLPTGSDSSGGGSVLSLGNWAFTDNDASVSGVPLMTGSGGAQPKLTVSVPLDVSGSAVLNGGLTVTAGTAEGGAETLKSFFQGPAVFEDGIQIGYDVTGGGGAGKTATLFQGFDNGTVHLNPTVQAAPLQRFETLVIDSDTELGNDATLKLGARGVTNGLHGDGLIKTTHGACHHVGSSLCPGGMWSAGYEPGFGNYCCEIYLSL